MGHAFIKRGLAISLALALMVTSAACGGAGGKATVEGDYIMTFEGELINAEDMRFCSSFVAGDGDSDGKAESLDALLTILTIIHQAKMQNLVLSAEDTEAVASYAEYWKFLYEYYEMPFPDISDERLNELLASEAYYEQLLDMHTEGYALDESAFAIALADYKLNNKQDYYDVRMKDVYTESREAAEEARDKLIAGEDVDAVIADYSVYYDATYGVEILSLSDYYLDEATAGELLTLGVSDISRVFDLDYGQYAVFIIQSIDIPSDETVEADYRETYSFMQRSAMFEVIIQQWKDEAQYEINQDVYDTIW